jgi:hypothetical protein
MSKKVENDTNIEIFIEWDRPYSLEKLKDLNSKKDYGVYQIYGTHPVYGSHVLLYIGKAIDQTFSKRVNQEGWRLNSDKKQVQIYVGRLFDKEKFENKLWENYVSLAEQLLIFSHWPAGNSSNINSLSQKKEMLEQFKNVRIYNYDDCRNIMPEISGKLYIEDLDFDEDHVFSK